MPGHGDPLGLSGSRKYGRAAECTRLESERPLKRTGGSNPSTSAEKPPAQQGVSSVSGHHPTIIPRQWRPGATSVGRCVAPVSLSRIASDGGGVRGRRRPSACGRRSPDRCRVWGEVRAVGAIAGVPCRGSARFDRRTEHLRVSRQTSQERFSGGKITSGGAYGHLVSFMKSMFNFGWRSSFRCRALSPTGSSVGLCRVSGCRLSRMWMCGVRGISPRYSPVVRGSILRSCLCRTGVGGGVGPSRGAARHRREVCPVLAGKGAVTSGGLCVRRRVPGGAGVSDGPYQGRAGMGLTWRVSRLGSCGCFRGGMSAACAPSSWCGSGPFLSWRPGGVLPPVSGVRAAVGEADYDGGQRWYLNALPD